MRTLGFVTALLAVTPAFAGDYVVLESAGDDAPFHAAALKLAAHHRAEVLRFDPADPEKILPALRKLAPRHVALVMPPRHIEFGFQRRFLDMATRLDDDPFVDFAFGYITGATGEEAAALVTAGLRAGEAQRAPVLGRLGGGSPRSRASEDVFRLRETTLPVTVASVRGEGDEHDRAFVAEFLPKLAPCTLVEFAGHGLPDRVVGALDVDDVKGLRLDGAVVLNVACWTGVTGTWYDDEKRVLVRKEIAPDRSLSLALLRTGLCGYTAYLCPRPQGTELSRDLVALAVHGDSLGDARRRDYDKVVLGFLGFGEERLHLGAPAAGEKIPRSRDAMRDIMLEDGTGGVVFGDPALRPFPARPGDDPVVVSHERTAAGIVVTAACRSDQLIRHCGESTGRIDGASAMKVYARLPLADLLVAEVVVDSIRVGARDIDSRVVWAVEDDHGERFLHAKVMFPRQRGLAPGEDLSLQFTVRRARDARSARRLDASPDRAAAAFITARVSADLRAVATRLDVSEKALDAGVAASVAFHASDKSAERDALAALVKFRAEGFRAVCALLEVGNAHTRTADLLEATYQPGEEAHLVAMAEKELPNHANWSALRGLGRTRSRAARTYLLERIGREKEAGCFLAAVEGLVFMSERAAAGTIGEQVLRFGASWNGVEGPLVDALGDLGGPVAVNWLRRYVADPRAGHADRARAHLKRIT